MLTVAHSKALIQDYLPPYLPTYLDHEVFDDAMKFAALVGEGDFRFFREALLACR